MLAYDVLHMTRDEFDAKVTAHEYHRLIAYLEIKNEREKKAIEKAQREAKSQRPRGSGRRRR